MAKQQGRYVARSTLTGFVGWVICAVAHIFFLIGFRNRVLVSAQRLTAYLSYEREADSSCGSCRS